MRVAVFDASALIPLVREQKDSQAALRASRHYLPIAPDHAATECSNVLRRFVRLEIMTAERAAEGQAILLSLLTFEPSLALVAEAMTIADRLDHPVYDCLYLVLAERAGAPLVSGDAKFLKKAAGSATIPLLDIAQLPEDLP